MNQQHPEVTRMDRAHGAVGAPMSTPLVATGDAQPIVGRVIEGEILDISIRSLAAQVRAEHAATARAVVGGLQHAIRAGQLLSQARPRIEAEAERKKGAWGRWLRDECGIPDRTARLYIRLYQHRATLTDLGNAAELSMRAAVRLIAPRHPPFIP
jgi:hypothetical protein